MKQLSIKIPRIITALLFVIGTLSIQFAFTAPTYAATKTWDGSAGDGKFSTAANWSGDSVPVSGDTLVFSGQVGGSINEAIILDNDLSGVAFSGVTIDTTTANVAKKFYLNTVTLQANATIGEASIGGGSGTDTLVFSTTAADGYYAAADGTVIAQGNLTVSYNKGLSAGVVTVAGNLTMSSRSVISAASSISGNIIISDSNNGLAFRGASTTIANNMSIGTAAFSDNPQLYFADCTGGFTGGVGSSGNAILCDAYATRTYVLTGAITLTGDVAIGIPDNTTVRIEGTVTYNGHTLTKLASMSSTSGVLQVVTVPGAPTNLVATPASAQVGLEWVAPASDGFDTITDYVVEYKLHSAGSWSTFSDGTSTATSATVTGLTNGQAYDFRVSAVNGKGTGSAVTITSITPSAAVTVPLAVSGVSAAIDATSKHAIISWTAPASNGGSAITDYLIEVKLSSGATWYTVSHSAFITTEAEILSGLSDGQTYDFRISPINAQGTGPSTTLSNFLYNPGNGTSGDLSGAGAGAVGVPNTGAMNFVTKNPLLIVGLGVTSAAVLLLLAKRRRSSL